MLKHNNTFLANLFYIIIISSIVIFVLSISGNIIIPIIIAGFISAGIISFSRFYQRFKIPHTLSIILSIFTFALILFFIGNILSKNINEILKDIPSYELIIRTKLSNLFYYLGISNIDIINDYIGKSDFTKIINNIITSFTSILSKLGIISIYTLFILMEYKYLGKKIILFLENIKVKKTKVIKVFTKVKEDLISYFIIKLTASLFTGFFTFLLLYLFGIKLAIFLGFLAFILNFIPTIGSMLFIFILTLFSLVFIDSIGYLFLILGTGISIQILIGNIIEPQFLGNKLNLSPLVIITSLIIWGSIWGIIGMFLAIPIMVIINIIMSNIESTKGIAILLSEKGNIDYFED